MMVVRYPFIYSENLYSATTRGLYSKALRTVTHSRIKVMTGNSKEENCNEMKRRKGNRRRGYELNGCMMGREFQGRDATSNGKIKRLKLEPCASRASPPPIICRPAAYASVAMYLFYLFCCNFR